MGALPTKRGRRAPDQSVIQNVMGASALEDFNEVRFAHQIDRALRSVKLILDRERQPRYPASVQHKYEDKYSLVGMYWCFDIPYTDRVCDQLNHCCTPSLFVFVGC